MSGTVIVTEPLIKEVLTAVESIRTPRNQYVSRTKIEKEIAEFPAKYPILSQASQTFRRQVITKVMKRKYRFWGSEEPKNRYSFVWNLLAPVEAAV